MSKSKRTLILVVLVIAVGAFLFYLFYVPSMDDAPSESTKVTTRSGPDITREGELYFIDNEEQDTLKRIVIEIADTEYDRGKGLMHRRNLPDSTGMLFVFNREKMQSFWMKNTPKSLDIIYVNNNMEVVSIAKHTIPNSEVPIPSGKPARYVVEVPAGFTDRYDVQEGDVISFKKDR